MYFRDRQEAGRLLAEAILAGPELAETPLVLAIPRGGVVVAAEVARALHAPLDVWLAHKIGAPGNPEFAIGSISADGEVTLDRATIAALGVPAAYVNEETERERGELARRLREFRGHAEPLRLEGKRVLLVDDGIATGATALSALAALRRAGAAARILAVPVAPTDTLPLLRAAADETVVLHAAPEFMAVGQFYERFEQVSDEEVVRLLRQGFTSRAPSAPRRFPGEAGSGPA